MDDNNNSLAWDMLKDQKKDNNILKILLGLSVIANIIIVLLLS